MSAARDLARQELARRELARRRLVPFACYVDPNSAAEYQTRHLQLAAEELEALERGDVDRLMIFMPNRHWKSSLASHKFAAWFVGKRASEQRPHQVMIISYGATLAEEISQTSRDMVQQNHLFQNVFPRVRIARNSQSAASWGLADPETGIDEPYPSCVAAGIAGGITGKGADLIIIDDPVKNAVEAGSRPIQERNLAAWNRDIRTRLNPGGAVVLIMTRWDVNDLAGKLLQLAADDPMADQWRVLVLPALAYTAEERTEARRLGIPVPDDDPLGRAPGEALWPERYSAQHHLVTKANDLTAFYSIAQQMPRKPGGYLMGRADFGMLDEPPREDVRWVWATDVAITEKQVTPRGQNDPDWTVALKVGLWTPAGDRRDMRIIFADMRRKQTSDPRGFLKDVMLECDPSIPWVGAQDNIDRVVFNDLRADEDLVAYTVQTLPRIPGDKLVKSAPWRNRVETGRVYVVNGPWNAAFFDEAEGFPKAGHDDIIDAGSVGVHALGVREAGVEVLPVSFYDLTARDLEMVQHGR